ncbi:hypothetical protein MASR1M45_19140 [Candidatus Kapaibacterium sp.]
MFFEKYCNLVAGVVIFIGTQNALSQDVKARLKSHYSTKVCGTAKEKEYLITVGVGEVKKTDSLYTFDVLLRFNSDDILHSKVQCI